ncbi:hypothetical protein D0Y65_037259 [Glycine soja]|uniref:Uncharacterized protein n=1 Tax=Glycine soja TaxID=3848 RepID=A0A445GZH6_GLYSO|nr:hypothetical protein D0Y65_037259 [Glycine soja]
MKRNCYLDLRLQSSSPSHRSMQAIWTLSFQYLPYDSLHLYISGIKQVEFFLRYLLILPPFLQDFLQEWNVEHTQ